MTKKDLVGVLQVLLQEKRLKVAPALEHAAMLATELQQFQLKAISLDPCAVEWREQPHDDLVLAVAVAAWQAERRGRGSPSWWCPAQRRVSRGGECDGSDTHRHCRSTAITGSVLG